MIRCLRSVLLAAVLLAIGLSAVQADDGALSFDRAAGFAAHTPDYTPRRHDFTRALKALEEAARAREAANQDVVCAERVKALGRIDCLLRSTLEILAEAGRS